MLTCEVEPIALRIFLWIVLMSLLCCPVCLLMSLVSYLMSRISYLLSQGRPWSTCRKWFSATCTTIWNSLTTRKCAGTSSRNALTHPAINRYKLTDGHAIQRWMVMWSILPPPLRFCDAISIPRCNKCFCTLLHFSKIVFCCVTSNYLRIITSKQKVCNVTILP